MYKIVTKTLLMIAIITTTALSATAQTVPPPSYCIAVDFSRSGQWYGVLPPTVSDALPLLDSIDRQGGEVAWASINSNPSTPLLRIRLPIPEEGLSEPEKSTNVFSRAKMLKRYRRDLPAHEAREKQRRENNKALIDAHIKELEAFLAQPADAQNSDVFGNVNRCATMLMEPGLYWSDASGKSEPNRHLIIVSDGMHNVASSEYESVDRSISISSVSGNAGGVTSKYGRRVKFFESTASAVLFTISNAERRR